MRPLNIVMKAFIAGAVTAMGIISAQAADKLTVRLDFIAWGTHAAMHLANEKGWFKEAGLDVEVQDGTGSGNTIQLVAAGQADIGQVQLGVMAVAKEKGADLISIAGWFRKSDLAVLVDRDSPISTIADLKGKSIVNFNGSYQVTEDVGLRFGVENLFNKAPPLTGVNTAADVTLGQLRGGSFAPGVYDTNGRRLYLGANIRF